MLFYRAESHKEIDLGIKHKEVLIQRRKKKFQTKVDQDLRNITKINRILGNGIALYITAAVGKHD